MKKSSRKNATKKRSTRKTIEVRTVVRKKQVKKPVAPAVVVGVTQEPKPTLVVKKPVTLAEAIAEPVVDIAGEKPVQVRKLVRNRRAS